MQNLLNSNTSQYSHSHSSCRCDTHIHTTRVSDGLPIDSQVNSDGNTGQSAVQKYIRVILIPSLAWTLFTAMTVTDTNVRDAMIDQIWNFASKNASQTIFPTDFTLDGKGSAVKNIAKYIPWLVAMIYAYHFLALAWEECLPHWH